MRPPATTAASTERMMVPLLVEISFCAASIAPPRDLPNQGCDTGRELRHVALQSAGYAVSGVVVDEVPPDVSVRRACVRWGGFVDGVCRIGAIRVTSRAVPAGDIEGRKRHHRDVAARASAASDERREIGVD